jgi:hypothetical protein
MQQPILRAGGCSELLVLLGILGVAPLACAADGLTPTDSAPSSSPQSLPGRWSLDFESSYVYDNVENPWFSMAGYHGADNSKNPWDYHLNSYILGARYDISDVHGWKFLRGYWQGSIGAIYSDILQGPEHYYAGAVGSMRYLFVPGDGTWAPYIEFRGGVGRTDASYVYYGQQDDTAFTYLLGVGLRYQPDRQWRLSLGIVDQHMSDMYLTNPNYGFDSAGFIVSIERRQ